MKLRWKIVIGAILLLVALFLAIRLLTTLVPMSIITITEIWHTK
jgi:hypothetical protein